MRIGLSQNRIKVPGGELMSEADGHGLVRGVNKTHGRLQNQTLSNFGAHAGSQAADGIKSNNLTAARARSRPVAFSQKRQQSAANGIPAQPGLGYPRQNLLS